MIIDADTHISPLKGDNRISVEELIEEMDQAGVDKALTWLQPPCTVAKSNEYVFQSMKKYPDKILGFGWADPREGVDTAINNVKKCVYDYGFYGVKLNGAQNDYYIDDEKLALPVIEEIAKTGKILAFHIGADAPDKTSPHRAAKIAQTFPGLKILLVHMGGAGTPEISDQVIEVAQKYPNMYLIGSNVSSRAILKAVKTLGAERICFGSDMPFVSISEALEKYEDLLDGEITEKKQHKIMGGNIKRLFEFQKS